jgi:hypothetical protein
MKLPSFPEYEVRVRCRFFANAVTSWLIKTTRMHSNKLDIQKNLTGHPSIFLQSPFFIWNLWTLK